jgi:hypothetical protein
MDAEARSARRREVPVEPDQYAVLALPKASNRLMERLKKANNEKATTVRVTAVDLAIVLNMVPRLSRANMELREEVAQMLTVAFGDDVLTEYLQSGTLPEWVTGCAKALLEPQRLMEEAPTKGKPLLDALALQQEDYEEVRAKWFATEAERSGALADPDVVPLRSLGVVP